MSTEPSGLRATSSFAGPSAPPVDEGVPAADPPPPLAPAPLASPIERTDQRDALEPPRAAPRKPPPRRRRKARRVHRVVHHLDVWSITKVTAVFVACGYLIGMISGYLLWQAADRVGTIDGIEGFIESSAAYESFEILGGVVFRVAAITGVVVALVVLATVVIGALLFNLISDLTGGIRMTVIDEDLIVAPARRPPEQGRSGPPR